MNSTFQVSEFFRGRTLDMVVDVDSAQLFADYLPRLPGIKAGIVVLLEGDVRVQIRAPIARRLGHVQVACLVLPIGIVDVLVNVPNLARRMAPVVLSRGEFVGLDGAIRVRLAEPVKQTA